VTIVVDASIVVRLLANRPTDDVLRQQFSARRTVHAPQLIDAEVASADHATSDALSPRPRNRIKE